MVLIDDAPFKYLGVIQVDSIQPLLRNARVRGEPHWAVVSRGTIGMLAAAGVTDVE